MNELQGGIIVACAISSAYALYQIMFELRKIRVALEKKNEP